jgi:hypothetical protein
VGNIFKEVGVAHLGGLSELWQLHLGCSSALSGRSKRMNSCGDRAMRDIQIRIMAVPHLISYQQKRLIKL